MRSSPATRRRSTISPTLSSAWVSRRKRRSAGTKALALKPDYAEAYSNLSNLLNDQGEYDRAEAAARKALELNPRLADAYINFAAVETARHATDALRALDALLAFAPGHARALAARALALKELDRLDEALDAAKRAALQAPESPEPHNAMGQVFQAMGDFEPALAAYDRAAALPGPAQQDAIANRGALFMEFGRKAEAMKALEDAAKAFPNSPGILFSQTDLKRFERGDPLIARMQALLRREGTSLADRATLHFGLGKAFLDIGNSAEAFRHYNEGNRLKRSTYAYDADADERWMASIAQVFSPALLKAKADEGARSDLPVFVLGMPRSGTTLIEQILASHPMVHGAGELKRLPTLIDGTGSFPASVRDLDPGAAEGAWARPISPAVAPMAAGARHVVDKMPSNFMRAGMIRLILPDARIIHCRRDPVDTCLSCYTKLFAGRAGVHLQPDGAWPLPSRLSDAHGALARGPAGLAFSRGGLRGRGGRPRAGGAADARLPRAPVGRGGSQVPRDRASGAHGERQSGAPAALPLVVGAVARPRR